MHQIDSKHHKKNKPKNHQFSTWTQTKLKLTMIESSHRWQSRSICLRKQPPKRHRTPNTPSFPAVGKWCQIRPSARRGLISSGSVFCTCPHITQVNDNPQVSNNHSVFGISRVWLWRSDVWSVLGTKSATKIWELY